MWVNMTIIWENVGKDDNYVGKCGYVWQLFGKMWVNMTIMWENMVNKAIMWENVGTYLKYVGKCW
jgi:hypothetical protein